MRILVTGSRLWTDKALVFEELDWIYVTYFLPEEDDLEFIVVHGACPNGADSFADEWVTLKKSRGYAYISVEPHPADWKGPRKRGAGYARNAEMVKLGADLCLAFIHNESDGATHCAGLAEKAGIETTIFRSTDRMSQVVRRSSNSIVKRVENPITLEDIRIIWKNFSGEKRLFNEQGKRNFAIPLDEATALKLREIGWNIKDNAHKIEQGQPVEYHIPVTVKMDARIPPRVFMIVRSKNIRIPLDEDTIGLLDTAELDTVDVVLRPFNWDVNGKQGVAAYLKLMYATLQEDPLDLKYAHIPLEGEPGSVDGLIENYSGDDVLEVDLSAIETDTGWEFEGDQKAIEA